jgi:hypothetical protein
MKLKESYYRIVDAAMLDDVKFRRELESDSLLVSGLPCTIRERLRWAEKLGFPDVCRRGRAIEDAFGGMVLVWCEDGTFRLEPRGGGREKYEEAGELLSALVAVVGSFPKCAPKWAEIYRMGDLPYDERLLWKEARLSGYDVMPGYSVIRVRLQPGMVAWSCGADLKRTPYVYYGIQYIDTGISAMWHVYQHSAAGHFFASFCFDSLEGAIEFTGRY